MTKIISVSSVFAFSAQIQTCISSTITFFQTHNVLSLSSQDHTANTHDSHILLNLKITQDY